MPRQRKRHSKRFRAAQARKRNNALNADKQNRFKAKLLNNDEKLINSCSPPPSVIDSLQDTISLPSSVCQDFFQNLLEVPDPDQTYTATVGDVGGRSDTDCEANIEMLHDMNRADRRAGNEGSSAPSREGPNPIGWSAASPATPLQHGRSSHSWSDNQLLDADTTPVASSVHFEGNSARALPRHTGEPDGYGSDDRHTPRHSKSVSRATQFATPFVRNSGPPPSRYAARSRASFVDQPHRREVYSSKTQIRREHGPQFTCDGELQPQYHSAPTMRARARRGGHSFREERYYARRSHERDNRRRGSSYDQLETKATVHSHGNPFCREKYGGDIVWRQSLAIFHALNAHPSDRHRCHPTSDARVRLALHSAARVLGAKSESFGEGPKRQVNVWLEAPPSELIRRTEYENSIIDIIRGIFHPEEGPYIPPSRRHPSLDSLQRESDKCDLSPKVLFPEDENGLGPATNVRGNVMSRLFMRDGDGKVRGTHDLPDRKTMRMDSANAGGIGPGESTFPLEKGIEMIKRGEHSCMKKALFAVKSEGDRVDEQRITTRRHDHINRQEDGGETRDEIRRAGWNQSDVTNGKVGDRGSEFKDSGYSPPQSEKSVKAEPVFRRGTSSPDILLSEQEIERYHWLPTSTRGLDRGGVTDEPAIKTVGPMTENPEFEDEIDRAFLESKYVGATKRASVSRRHKPTRKSNKSGDDDDEDTVEGERSRSVNLSARRLGKENKGFELLRRLGWNEDQGLGADKDGRLDPVGHVHRQTRRQGVGH